MGFEQPAAIFRRQTYERMNGFDETLHYRADADFFIRALLGGENFAKLSGPPAACFRLHSGQFSNRGIQHSETEADSIYGREALKAAFGDWLTLVGWRLSNLPHYVIRIIRESMLSSR